MLSMLNGKLKFELQISFYCAFLNFTFFLFSKDLKKFLPSLASILKTDQKPSNKVNKYFYLKFIKALNKFFL